MTYNSENSLPNHRVAKECCYNCKNFDPGLEVEDGDFCGVLERIREEKEDFDNGIFVDTSTSKGNVCDLWEMVE